MMRRVACDSTMSAMQCMATRRSMPGRVSTSGPPGTNMRSASVTFEALEETADGIGDASVGASDDQGSHGHVVCQKAAC